MNKKKAEKKTKKQFDGACISMGHRCNVSNVTHKGNREQGTHEIGSINGKQSNSNVLCTCVAKNELAVIHFFRFVFVGLSCFLGFIKSQTMCYEKYFQQHHAQQQQRKIIKN